jgi:hypothetical protein
MWKVNGWQTTDAKWWQKLMLPLARWANKNGNFCLLSLGLWSFIVVFYRKNKFLLSAKNKARDIFHLREKFYFFLPSSHCAPLAKCNNFSHSSKISLIFIWTHTRTYQSEFWNNKVLQNMKVYFIKY